MCISAETGAARMCGVERSPLGLATGYGQLGEPRRGAAHLPVAHRCTQGSRAILPVTVLAQAVEHVLKMRCLGCR